MPPDSKDHDEAQLQECPRALHLAPWNQPAPEPLPRCDNLEPLPELTPGVIWSEGERERVLETYPEDTGAPAQKSALAMLAQHRLAGEPCEFSSVFRSIPPERVPTLWSEYPPHSTWKKIFEEDLLYIWACLEGAALPDLFAVHAVNRIDRFAAARLGLPGAPTDMLTIAFSSQDEKESARAIEWVDAHPALAVPDVVTRLDNPATLEWLVQHAETVIDPLLRGSLRTAPVDLPFQPDRMGRALRWLARHGRRETILAEADRLGVRDVTDLLLDPRRDLPWPKRARPVLPDWWKPENFPRPRLVSNGKPLPMEAMDSLCHMLALGLQATHPLLEPALDALTEQSKLELARVILAAFEEDFSSASAASARWCLWSISALGGDWAARVLGRKARRWAQSIDEPLKHNAMQVADILADARTSVALTQLGELAATTPWLTFKNAALDRLAVIALEQSLQEPSEPPE